MGWRVILSGFAGAALLLGVILYLTPVFEIQHDQIDITGNITLSREEILELVRVRNGMKLARVRPQLIETRLLRHPLIREASVRFRIPSGLSIHIAERRPWATWLGSKLVFQVSDDGRILDVGYPVRSGKVVTVRDSRPTPYLRPVDIGMDIDHLWGYDLAKPLARITALTGVDRITIEQSGMVIGQGPGEKSVKLGKATEMRETARLMDRIPRDLWARIHTCRNADYDIYGFVVVSGCDQSHTQDASSHAERPTGTDI
ncbi:MAG: cell division protein FtsQ/DivIB [bacterium JZ-2024 1]